MDCEPLVTDATVIAVVTALLALGASFGLDLSDGQRNAVLGAVAVLAPLVLAYISRRKVTPNADPRAADGTPLVRLDSTSLNG
jgi:hypothetical protein